MSSTPCIDNIGNYLVVLLTVKDFVPPTANMHIDVGYALMYICEQAHIFPFFLYHTNEKNLDQTNKMTTLPLEILTSS